MRHIIILSPYLSNESMPVQPRFGAARNQRWRNVISEYFTGVQHQMFVCEKQEEYFYVYKTKDRFTEKIKFNLSYTTNLPKYEHFFNDYICPELFTNKTLSKVIARSILKEKLMLPPVLLK